MDVHMEWLLPRSSVCASWQSRLYLRGELFHSTSLISDTRTDEMVYLATAEEWQKQSMLLLEARPTTTKITTKYNIPNPESPALVKRLAKRKINHGKHEGDAGAASEAQVATLTLKTYDPASGVVLKFQTDKAADVGRLINILGRAGRRMAALPEKQEALDVVMEDAATSDKPTSTADVTATPVSSDAKAKQGAGGGKKKKGKNKK
ncbi:hypothetical protein AC579_8449 [Pseudocercospora musae]|uniref:SRP9 domain-containing protein n=1 Tax=Pseudocercospora musae TaxID=113226 RepID=A0A139GVY4_9PEZI|nr:hypothetical protein AC579_8449 [Pseudocercospora musae]